ncbi:unnamed protein product [Durusdinium trenchii]|uniref:Uncharacterized protein n=1 Tax=Durusdinium trenchii TaxID=1381693 RepID=A0ABP0QWL7_9DINO
MTSFTFDSAVIFMKVPGHDASEMSIAVDHKMMALDAIRWEETWGERKIEQAAQAQHLGNRLLSIEGRKIAPNEILHEVLSQSASGCVTLSDYSQLGPSAMQICSIGATEFRGITVVQLEALLDFVKDMAPYWYETFGPAAGQALAFETFNLYHANNWIILPSTQGRGGRDAWVSPWMMEIHKGCSYVELVSREAEAQRPQWFVSHAWKEPIVNFVACLRKHLTVRDLGRESPYWVCAYANNQHRVDEEIPEDPRESAFFRAMKVSDGVLLILDTHATPFTRIWCCFEESVAVEERDSSGALLLDLATASADAKDASLVTDGLAGVETQMMPLLGMLAKSQREASFPAEIMQRGLEVDIKQAQAAVAEDKNRILNSIISRHPDAVSRVTGKDLALQPPPSHESYDLVNRALASHFSLSSWFSFMMKGHNCQNLMEAISADQGRQMVQLSMTGCFSFKDSDLQSLVQCLPEKLRVLRLDLAFTGLDSPFDGSLEFPSSLEQLVLRFAGSLQSVEGLPAMLFPLKLSRLELWLCNLPALSTIGPLGDAIKRSRPGELVLQLNGCPQLSLAIKEDLHRSLQVLLLWARVKRHVHIEDVSSAWSCLRRRADAVPERTLTVEDPSQSFCSDAEIEMMLPYPCSQAGCKEFHPNEHGFCSRHRHSRFFWKVRPTLRLAWQAGELALLFSIQALFEARSRFVLVFFGLSLYPVLCMMIADSMGLSFGLTFSTTLLVVLASMAYTSGRFDSMRGAMQKLCLAMEASYFQVLHTTGLSQLFEEVGVLETLRQDVQDLKSNFMEARRCRGLFQKVICDPLSVEGVVKAKLKLPTEIGTFPGAECSVDLLYCEVICQNMSSLRRSWCILKDLVASNNLGQVDRNGDEVDVDLDVDLDDLGVSTTATCPLKIMAVRDDFVAFRGRPCGRVVVSIDGYLATVMFLEAKLSRLDAELGDVCHLAEKVGLLDDVKPQNWGAVKVRVAETSRFRRSMLLCVRWLAGTFAGFFCQGHFRLAMNAQQSSELSLPKEILAVLFSLPFLVLLLAFIRDIFFPQQEHDLCSTMVVYEKYLGAQGRYYISKVAIVQIGSVCLQALGRLRVFGAMVNLRRTSDYGGYLAIHEVDGPEVVYYWDYWAFIGLLLVNLTYPNVLFFFPHKQ